jgi:FkbM family methyltransferase
MIRNPLIMRKIFRISPKTILHIGAHRGQDGLSYQKLGAELVLWGEADSASAKILREKFPDDIVVEAVFWSESGLLVDFYEFKSGASNSAISPEDLSLVTHIAKKRTTSLDQLLSVFTFELPILIVLDVQGAEMQVLAGGLNILSKTKYLIIEIAEKSQGYKITPSKSDIYEFLNTYGYKPSIKRFSHDKSYFDQLFIKSTYFDFLWISFFDSTLSKLKFFKHWFLYRHWPDSAYYCGNCK